MRERRATGGIGLVIYLFLVPRSIIDLRFEIGYKESTVPEKVPRIGIRETSAGGYVKSEIRLHSAGFRIGQR